MKLKINTLFYKFLVLFTLFLTIMLIFCNLKDYLGVEPFTALKPPSIDISAKFENNKIVLRWKKPDRFFFKKYTIVMFENGAGPNYIFPNKSNLNKRFCQHKLDGFDETKTYKFGIFATNFENVNGEIQNYTTIGNLKEKIEREEQLKETGTVNKKISCNPDGTYNILDTCQDRPKYVKSNYSDLTYKILNDKLSQKKYNIEFNLV